MVKMYQGIDKLFVETCKENKIQPTRRQYKKWQRKSGSAWNTRNHEPSAADSSAVAPEA